MTHGHPFINPKNHASKGYLKTDMPDEREMRTDPFEEDEMKKPAKKLVKKAKKK